MEQNIENLGTIKCKVKLADVYYDFVIEWSQERQCYEPQQFFKQLASISGIPLKCTYLIAIAGAPRPNNQPPSYRFFYNQEAEINKDRTIENEILLCNELIKLMVHYMDHGIDCFILRFTMLCMTNSLTINYCMLPEDERLVSADRCISQGAEWWRTVYFCRYGSSKSMLDRIRSILTNEELKSKIADLLPLSPANTDYYQRATIRHNFLMHFNIRQCLKPNCSSDLLRFCITSNHLYLRTRG
ncbi:uncharacterized protein LOC107365564 [Tetranychus urticae]|nr:uncharacterized protein LOC107365564 [Tetranychus urticae]